MLQDEISFCQPPEKSLLDKINQKFSFNLKDISYNEKSFDDVALKESFKLYLNNFLIDNEKNTCVNCWKNLSKSGSKFFNFKTENFIKKLKDAFFDMKIFREEVFKLFEKIMNEWGSLEEIDCLKKDLLFLVKFKIFLFISIDFISG